MERRDHPLLSAAIGVQQTLTSLHFGVGAAGPKVYIQASLHAEELPGMLVAHHLRALLQQAEAEGRLLGEVVLVPVANPIGLAQRLDHRAMGRFEFGSSENFNRHYPDLAQAIWPLCADELGPDPAHNVAVVRRAVAQYLARWTPETVLQSLRHRLLSLAHDADLVLDLHCDCEAVMHLYTEEPCWPALAPLAALLECEAVLLARDSGGGPFDECLSGLWWQLGRRLREAGRDCPLPQACATTTVELRGESDVSHGWAQKDAAAIARFLAHVGVLHPQETAPPLPVLRCTPTPLPGSETLTSPVPGVLVFLAQPGQHLRAGDRVAEVIDPLADRTHPIVAGVDGVFYARVKERFVLAGEEVGKVAGAIPFRSGPLLGY